MTIERFRLMLKPWMLPISMIIGAIFHNYMEAIAWLAPWLIFAMLLITFCRIRPREIHVTPLSWMLLAVQLGGAGLGYALCCPMGEAIAQGVFICIFCPTATAAPVITGMLGGSIPRLVTFSIVSNISVAILAPPAFALLGAETSMTMLQSTLLIAKRVVPLIIAPLFIAFFLERFSPKIHHKISENQGLSFYLWACSLVLTVGRSVSFIISEPASMIPTMIGLAVLSAVACGIQFAAGHWIGKRYGDQISGTQGLGQKNTVLAIWMALTYLNPVASVAPAAYVAWQNTFNSLQLYFKTRRDIQQS